MSELAIRLRKGRLPGAAATYVVFGITLLIVSFPLVWMLYTSFKPQFAIYESVFSLPTSNFTFENYVTVWADGDFGQAIINSLTVVVPSVLGVLAISAPAAYAFARLNFPGKKILFVFMLAGLAVPPAAIVIPAYRIMSTLGLVNSYFSLIFMYLSWCPLGIVILTAFFRSMPNEIEEAAKADGAGTFRIFRSIALPLAKPAIGTVVIFYFIYIWNDFLYPLVFLQSEDKFTIPLRLATYTGRYSVDWGALTAALSLATIVPVLFYLAFQPWFIRGISAGSVKG